MYATIIHCKSKILLSTDGRVGKAMCLGEKHHVAWHFLILNPMVNEICMPVDCCYLLSVVHNSDPLEDNSTQDYEMDVDNDNDDNDHNVNDIRNDDGDDIKDEDNDEKEEEDPTMVLENVRELTLLPEGEVLLLMSLSWIIFVKNC